jgi:hypothetical protein
MNILSIGLVYHKLLQLIKSIHFRKVRRICEFFGNQTVKLISLLCSSTWTSRGSKQGHHQIDQTQDWWKS